MRQKERLGFLVVGIAIGLLIYRLSDRQISPSISPTSPQNSIETVTHQQAHAPTITAQLKPIKKLKIIPGYQVEIPSNQPQQEQPTAAANQSEKTYGVRIEEATVRELEEEKELLRQHAYAELRDDGWQIHILEEDRALLHSGLSDGDIITHDGIQSQLRMSDRVALVNRFVALLKYIER